MGETLGDVGGDVMEVTIKMDATTLQFDSDPSTECVATSTEYVVSLGGNRYRLDWTPFPVDPDDELWLGDFINLEPGENGVLLFRGIVSKSPWRHLDWAPGRHKSAFEAFTDVLDTAGAKLEHVLGGCFLRASAARFGI
jgi:hypothetical protein